MKIDLKDDKIIIYLRNTFFEEELKSVTKEIKNIFIRLLTYYHLKLSGLYDVFAFENKKYGTILELIKKESLFHPDIIDIKVKIWKDKNFYLRTKDYFVFQNIDSVYYEKEYYYVDLYEISNINTVIEFVDILYNKKDNYLRTMKLLK